MADPDSGAWGFPGTSTPIVGDWNGDGKSKVGSFTAGLWTLDVNGNVVLDAGDPQFMWGTTGDRLVVGKW